jgi:hypothetical protein
MLLCHSSHQKWFVPFMTRSFFALVQLYFVAISVLEVPIHSAIDPLILFRLYMFVIQLTAAALA